MKQSKTNKLWFKAKTYGWGWTPVSWQGWLVVLVYTLFIIKIAQKAESSPENIFIDFFIPMIIMTGLLIAIGYWKGEKPRWSWGEKKQTKKFK